MNEPDTHAVYPPRQTTLRRWPGIVILLALVVAGAVLLVCASLAPWLLR